MLGLSHAHLCLGQYFCPIHVTPDLDGTNLEVQEPDENVGLINIDNAKETSDYDSK